MGGNGEKGRNPDEAGGKYDGEINRESTRYEVRSTALLTTDF